MGFLGKLFGGGGLGLEELEKRLRISQKELAQVPIVYKQFVIPKRSGGQRILHAPEKRLKEIQRAIHFRLLRKLRAHPAAVGFERGKSVVDNALPHLHKAVVLRLDLQDFFPATSAKRVEKFFRKIGWNREAAALLTKLCTREGGLPQGAPTSPRLSTLVNYRLDMRAAAAAKKLGAVYTRYADDMTFSFAKDERKKIHSIISIVKDAAQDEGYSLHLGKKLKIRRRHQAQIVTGLVVNEKVQLPRSTRRRLRAIQHRLKVRGRADLTQAQLDGWKSFAAMVAKRAGNSRGA